MAFAKRYYSNFKSLAGYNYRLEIWQEDYTGSSYEILLGKGGPKLSYKADKDDRYASIIASTLKVPITIAVGTSPNIVGTLDLIAFQEELRNSLEEKQVYIHLYRKGTSGTVSGTRPLWSGYVLIDFTSSVDESYPNEFSITATDGLGILKNIDFVEDGATAPYDEMDIFTTSKRFTEYIYHILNSMGVATTSEGAGENWSYSTSVEWYNEEHQGTTNAYDPLYLTKGKCMHFYTPEEQDDGSTIYNADDSYKVLQKILQAWGCRIVYWQHRYHIIQIDTYENSAGGTFASPSNIKTRIYDNSNSSVSNLDYLGNNYWTPYELIINDQVSTPEYIKKLSTTKYDYTTPIAKVDAKFIVGGATNHYMGFPFPFLGGVNKENTQKLNNLLGADSLYVEFELTCDHNNANGILNGTNLGSADASNNLGSNMTWSAFDCRVYFQLGIVTPAGSQGGWTVSQYTQIGIYNSTSGNHEIVDKSSTPYDDTNLPYFQFNNIPKNGSKTQTFGFNFERISTDAILAGEFKVSLELQAGRQSQNPAFTFALSNKSAVGFDPISVPKTGGGTTDVSTFLAVRDANNPSTGWTPIHTNTATLDVGLGAFTFHETPNPQSLWTATYNTQHNVGLAAYIGMFQFTSWANNSGLINNIPPNVGVLTFINSTTLSAVNITSTASDNDTFIYDLQGLLWGDTPATTDTATLEVWDGSAWVFTNYTGKWGRDTTSGTTRFVTLLMEEILKGGAHSLKKASMDLVMLENGKTKSDGSGTNQWQFISPVTKIKESDPLNLSSHIEYIMLRGDFHIAQDEWSGEWIQFDRDNSLSVTSSLTDVITPLQNVIQGTGAGINCIGASQGYNFNNLGLMITTTSANITAATLTEIDINKIGVAVLKSGDSISLLDQYSSIVQTLTVNADQSADDTTLTITSTTFSTLIPAGALIYMTRADLKSQVDHKTRGTIAGMPVDADELGCIKYDAGDSVYTIDADTIIGVDLDYIKILPSDFLANDDNTTYSVAWKDGSGQTGVIPEDGALEMFAFVSIPSGKTATKVDVWGSNAKALNVYEHDVNAGAGMGTAIGTGTVNTELDITDTASTATNYLVIKITTTATSNRIYGGKVTIIDTP